MQEWEWEKMRINIILREGMGMFLYTTLRMGGNGIEKFISAYLHFVLIIIHKYVYNVLSDHSLIQ